MFRMWDVQNAECLGWDVWNVGCWGCEMLKNWDVQEVGYSGFGVLGCGLFKIWYVWNVGCWG